MAACVDAMRASMRCPGDLRAGVLIGDRWLVRWRDGQSGVPVSVAARTWARKCNRLPDLCPTRHPTQANDHSRAWRAGWYPELDVEPDAAENVALPSSSSRGNVMKREFFGSRRTAGHLLR